jgi:hypothetical protein
MGEPDNFFCQVFMQTDNVLALPRRITGRRGKEKALRLKAKERQDSCLEQPCMLPPHEAKDCAETIEPMRSWCDPLTMHGVSNL